jgi:gliding motility-associated-like protein
VKRILFIIIWLLFFFTKAQNFVPNGSFENISQCPVNCIGTTTSTLAIGWINPNIGSSDLFSTCDIAMCGGGWNKPCHGVPLNCWGFHTPHTGNNYAGLAVYGKYQANAREYVETQTISSLLTNKKYCVSFYTSIADSFSGYSTSRLGAYISSASVTSSSSFLLSATPQVENPYNNFLNNYTGWTAIQGTFTANGGEDYITIGNFYDDMNTDTLSFLNQSITYPGSYYYIDDVSLFEYGNAYAGGDTTICKGVAVNLGNNNVSFRANYNWSILKGDSSSLKYNDTLSYNIAQPKKTTTYVLQKKQCGIFSYDTLTIHIPTAVMAKASNDTTICIGDSALISSYNLCNWCTYNWQPMQNHNTQVIVKPLASTTYILSVKDSCFTTYSNVTVSIDYCQSPIVVMPNIFTPNTDGINDAWQPLIQNALSVLNYKCTIYDRWGIQVFDAPTTLNNIAWDGHSTSGLECSAGTYYYVLSYTDGKTNEQKNLKGFLELVR